MPPQGPLPGAPERVGAGRERLPVVGPGGSSGSPEGSGAPCTGTALGELVLAGGGAAPQGRRDGAGAEAVPAARGSGRAAGRRSRVSAAALALSVLGYLVARHSLLS